MIEVKEGQAPSSGARREMYLSSDVKIEALVDRWYAWPHLLCPARQALNLAFRYLPIVRSFIAAPAVHSSAAKDPSMFGGPFLDLPETAVPEVARYVDDLLIRRSEGLQFARAFREFDVILQSAGGYSLDDLREQAPDPLRGLMELVYDLNSHPKIRLLDEMFEDHDLGHGAAQEVLLHRERDVDRPFFLSTPRLAVADGLYLRGEFGSDAIRALCASRHSAVDLEALASALSQPAAVLAPFFSEAPSRPQGRSYVGDGVRIRYFGHACLLIETADVSILVDPTAARDRTAGADHLTLDDLPDRIDVLFISHGHQDHFSPETLMQLRDRVGVVLIPPNNHGDAADPSLRRLLTQLGFASIITLEPLDRYDLPEGAITALPFSGEHCDLDVHSKQCALVELRGRRICLFVDSDAIDFDVYRRLAPRLQDADVMFLGMECFGAPLSWMYGPLISTSVSNKNDTSRRLSGADCRRAWRLTEALRPKEVCVYAMGQEPWMRHLMGLSYTDESVQLKESNAFIACCRGAGIPAERLYMNREMEL